MTILTTPVEATDFLAILRDREPLTRDDIREMMALAAGPNASRFRQAVDEISSAAESDGKLKTRAGIGAFLLGQPMRAIEILKEQSRDGLAHFYLAQAYSTTDQHEEAADAFQKAADLGYEPVEAVLRKAGEVRLGGDVDGAETVIKSTSSDGGARLPEYSYQMGEVMAARGDALGAIEYFERAVDMDPQHQRALFALAVQNSIHGNDEDAIQLYERALAKPPFLMGAMFNLGLLYEDQENYKAARYCFEKILSFDPENERARLYLKDIEATSDMYYDEDSLRAQARLEQLLNRPVTDFELSVRSRNCLAAMQIKTLGDLTRTTESELLSGKNFGETSLIEIRELMRQHDLEIGQNISEKFEEQSGPSLQDLSPQEQAVLAQPVSDLNLSVRARKCMNRLGIATIGELVGRTPDELLAAKNFGVTSLNEVRAKLSELDIKLRND